MMGFRVRELQALGAMSIRSRPLQTGMHHDKNKTPQTYMHAQQATTTKKKTTPHTNKKHKQVTCAPISANNSTGNDLERLRQTVVDGKARVMHAPRRCKVTVSARRCYDPPNER